jgi:hypothetical protein
MRKLVAIVLLVLAAGAVAGCKSSEEEGAGVTGSGGAAAEDVSSRAAEGGVGGGGSGQAAPAPSPVPEIGPQIVQTASLRVSIKRGTFDETVLEARSIATALGGFVVDSSASQGPAQRLVRGTLVVRVPARSYGDAIESIEALGRVEARNESGQDVSQEYVDLRARIRQLQAVESQLLELLDRAETVGAALAVQQQLSQVQLDLEQARGRLQYLDDRIAFATISLAIHERVVPAPAAEDDGFGIVDAWSKAGHGFLAVIGWTFVVLATAAPIVLLLVLAFLLVRMGFRGRPTWLRRPAA